MGFKVNINFSKSIIYVIDLHSKSVLLTWSWQRFSKSISSLFKERIDKYIFAVDVIVFYRVQGELWENRLYINKELIIIVHFSKLQIFRRSSSFFICIFLICTFNLHEKSRGGSGGTGGAWRDKFGVNFGLNRL